LKKAKFLVVILSKFGIRFSFDKGLYRCFIFNNTNGKHLEKKSYNKEMLPIENCNRGKQNLFICLFEIDQRGLREKIRSCAVVESGNKQKNKARFFVNKQTLDK
jgi:hypothetical protein